MVILSIYLVELSIAGNFFSFFRYPNSSSYSAQDMSAIGGHLHGPKDAHTGWTADTTPTSIASNDYDVILAADGKQQSLSGFRAKEFRAKLALAITVNFVNHNTQAENSVPEIGGVAFVYRQEFFNSLAKTHDIELENIVYYKDETHYLVMTVRKQSLLRKGDGVWGVRCVFGRCGVVCEVWCVWSVYGVCDAVEHVSIVPQSLQHVF